SKGTAPDSGVISIDLSSIPYAPSDQSVIPLIIENATNYISSGGGAINAGGNQIYPSSSTAVGMRVSNLQAGTRISGMFTFGVNGTSWL
ncbi:TPA: hypothetical protein M5882_003616, partial [Escherichia coli]|nr:hypothetical protein [Escherichia coli]